MKRSLACVVASTLVLGPVAVRAQSAPPDTLAGVVPLPGVTVSTTRMNAASPFSHSTLDREALVRRNWGQDTPMALAALPGVHAYSDAGNGIGYSYLSIRGFPQRRLSVLVNGVPLNDPESHEVYWIDHPDLLASAREVTVQRGVGSALYGAAAVGGSISIETGPRSSVPAFSATAAAGSFGTRRWMVEGSSGPLEGGWSLYGRYSRIQSDGYRERADSRLWSYALSAERRAGTHALKVNLYGGPEETHLAYLGVPRVVLDGGLTGDPDRDRRFNPLAWDGERDHFFEPHYEMIHTWTPGPRLALSQTLFYFDGEGYYDERRYGQALASYRLPEWTTSDSTLYPHAYYRDSDGDGNLDVDAQGRVTVERFDLARRRWVRNRHYGWVPRVQLRHGGHTITAGGEIRAHDGRHVGTVIAGDAPPGTEPGHRYYDYHPRTLTAGLFLRDAWRTGARWTWTADLAWRHQDYFMRGDRFDGIRFDQPYDFLLPRLGAHYAFAGGGAFAAVGHGRREPAFRDLYDAEGAGSVPLYAGGEPLVRPERVTDYAAGIEWHPGRWQLRADLYHMDFRDELVYAGQFNTDLGYPILGNAARSVHQGLELAAAWRLGAIEASPAFGAATRPELMIEASATLGDHHFVEYREAYGPTPADEVRYDGNAIGGSPATLAHLAARGGCRGVVLGISTRHIGRIFVDATERREASIDPATVIDLDGRWRLPWNQGTVEAGVRVFNLLDHRYETAGYMDLDATGTYVPHLIPAATRGWLAEFRIAF